MRYLNPLSKKSVNEFVLVATKILFQVGKVVQCAAVHGEEAPRTTVFKGRICSEIGLHLIRERVWLDAIEVSRSWRRPPVILQMTGTT